MANFFIRRPIVAMVISILIVLVGTAALLQLPVYASTAALPPPAVLRRLLATCYQASLLQDEGRGVRFRLLVCEPSALRAEKLAEHDCQGLRFAAPHEFTVNELRRLAAAAAFERALISARVRRHGRLEIWGLVHSGEQWLRALEGSRRSFSALPPCLVVHVMGPGNLTAGKGSLTVARLVGGQLATPAPGVLEIRSRSDNDDVVNRVFLTAYNRVRARHGRRWAQVCAALINQLRRQVALRLLSAMRRSSHGGTLLVLPLALTDQPQRWQRMLKLKYACAPAPWRRRLFSLLVTLMAALAKDCGQRFGPDHQVT